MQARVAVVAEQKDESDLVKSYFEKLKSDDNPQLENFRNLWEKVSTAWPENRAEYFLQLSKFLHQKLEKIILSIGIQTTDIWTVERESAHNNILIHADNYLNICKKIHKEKSYQHDSSSNMLMDILKTFYNASHFHHTHADKLAKPEKQSMPGYELSQSGILFAESIPNELLKDNQIELKRSIVSNLQVLQLAILRKETDRLACLIQTNHCNTKIADISKLKSEAEEKMKVAATSLSHCEISEAKIYYLESASKFQKVLNLIEEISLLKQNQHLKNSVEDNLKKCRETLTHINEMLDPTLVKAVKPASTEPRPIQEGYVTISVATNRHLLHQPSSRMQNSLETKNNEDKYAQEESKTNAPRH